MGILDDDRLYTNKESVKFLRFLTGLALVASIYIALEGTLLIVLAIARYGWQ